MTPGAKGEQILQSVGFEVMVVQTEGPEVMDGQIVSLPAAVLTGVGVSQASGIPLRIPVLASIGGMPSSPCRIAGPGIHHASPGERTLTAAEVPLRHGGGMTDHGASAGGAIDGDLLATHALPVDLLPFGVTLEAAEGVLRHRCMVGFASDSRATLGAVDGFHTSIVAQMAN